MLERGTTPRAVSRAIGDNPYVLRDILSGKSQNPRSDTIAKIAEHLGVPLSTIMNVENATYANNSGHTKGVIPPKFLPVRFRVQGGYWLENYGEEPVRAPPHPVAPHPRFAEFPQWLEEVIGDSVDKRIPPGGFAHVVDTMEMGYQPRDGDWVVVERLRSQGELRERTIKQIEVAPTGERRLWPRSFNPKWSEPLELTEGAKPEDVEVRVVGLVIGFYSSFV